MDRKQLNRSIANNIRKLKAIEQNNRKLIKSLDKAIMAQPANRRELPRGLTYQI